MNQSEQAQDREYLRQPEPLTGRCATDIVEIEGLVTDGQGALLNRGPNGAAIHCFALKPWRQVGGSLNQEQLVLVRFVDPNYN